MIRKNQAFIVVYDDADCITAPMVWDSDCNGAICCGVSGKDQIAMFPDRKAANKAIEISTLHAKLCKAQGKPTNEDFLGVFRKNIKVVPCGVLTGKDEK